MVRKVFVVALAAFAGILLTNLAGAPASAQYPPAAGSVTVAAANASPTVGQTVSLAATVHDAGGAPMAGVSCSFSIGSQPGSDANVAPSNAVTDATGIATTGLNVGSTPGTITVEALCGELSTQISVAAGAAEAPSTTGTTAAPSATGATAGQLPGAGSGPSQAAQSRTFFYWAALVLAVLFAPGALYLSLRLRN